MLLDTHVLLWWALGDPRLGPRTLRALQVPGSRLLVSAVSFWEIAIKVSAGRLELQTDLEADAVARGLVDLPLSRRHGLVAGALPPLHRDPFDRALVAQAQVEGLRLVTGDEAVLAYDVDTLDART